MLEISEKLKPQNHPVQSMQSQILHLSSHINWWLQRCCLRYQRRNDCIGPDMYSHPPKFPFQTTSQQICCFELFSSSATHLWCLPPHQTFPPSCYDDIFVPLPSPQPVATEQKICHTRQRFSIPEIPFFVFIRFCWWDVLLCRRDWWDQTSCFLFFCPVLKHLFKESNLYCF